MSIVDVTNNHIIYHASALGSYTRALVAARQQYQPLDPPSYALKIFDAGHDIEDTFMFDNPDITDHQEEITLQITSKIYIVGHIDGKRDGRIVEVKSQSEELFDKWTPASWSADPMWRKYAWQTSCYMIARQAELELVRIARDPAQGPKIESRIYEQPFHTINEIRARILNIESLAAEDSLPDKCDHNDWVCPYRYTHPVQEPEDDEPEDDEILQGLVRQYLEVKRAGDDVRETIAALKAKIEARLGPRDKVLLMSGDTVSRSTFTKHAYTVSEHEETRLSVKSTDK